MALVMAPAATVSAQPATIATIQPSARIDGGNWHTVWLAPDGRVATTGDNRYGQLGDGTTTNRTVSAFVPNLTGAVAVTAGRYHNLALDSSGQVWAWGRNNSGQLGDGTQINRLSPVPIQVTGQANIVAVSAGQFYSLALDATGQVWSWGLNNSGQLGNRTTTNSLVPVQVDDRQMGAVVAINAGLSYALAIDTTGTAWGWGHNLSGQVGDGTRTDRTAPVRVVDSAMGTVVAVDGAAGQSLAIDATGAAWAWGNNFEGQLGDGTNVNSAVPVRVDDSQMGDVVAIAGKFSHSLAIDSDGDVWSWGRNAFGQLGDGSEANRPAPVPVIMTDIDNEVTDIAAGIEHSLAIEEFPDLDSWAPWAWGQGAFGQLGSGGSGSDSLEPVPMGPPASG